jgi:SAM-dependent methyltransferase
MSVRQACMLQVVDGLGLPARARVLDAGCGPGLLLERLAERGLQVFGLDASPAMLRRASERRSPARLGALPLQLGNVEELPYRDASFDLVCSAGVIEYLAQDGRALTEMRRVLRPGGYLVLATTNARSPALYLTSLVDFLKRRTSVLASFNAVWQRLGHRPVRARHFRVRRHRPAQLRGALAQAGLRLRGEDFFYLLPWPQPLDRLLPGPTAALERRLAGYARSPLGRLAAGYLTVSSAGPV